MSEMNRRQFVVLMAGAFACGCCLGGGAEQAGADAPAIAAGPLDIGTLADYPDDGAYDKFRRPHKVLVVRNEGKLYAATAMCTHKSQTLSVKDGQIRCPAHASTFSLDGIPSGGPAKASLDRFAISKREDGHILVDTSKVFPEQEWDKPEAFIVIEGA